MEFLSFLFYSVYFDNETPVTEAPVKISKAPDLPEADVCCGHGMYTSDGFMNLHFLVNLMILPKWHLSFPFRNSLQQRRKDLLRKWPCQKIFGDWIGCMFYHR